MELGLWSENKTFQRISLADVLEKHLGPGKLLVPHAKLENDKLIFEKDGLSFYTVKKLKTKYKFLYQDLKGKGAKEVQLTQDVPGSHLLDIMSKAWEWVDSRVKVEFHTRPRRRFANDMQKEFTEAINSTNSLHLRADVLLSALPRTSANIMGPLTDWRTRICWVTVKTSLEDEAKIRKLVAKEDGKLKKQVEIYTELLEKGIAVPSKEERKRMKDEIKAKEDIGDLRQQREVMFDRIDKEHPLICPIVRRVAPPYAPAEQLLVLARSIAWKLPHIKKLFRTSPVVYQKIRATMTIDETKESVQARIKKLLKKGVEDPELPAPSTTDRPFGAPFSHPFLLGTKKLKPNEDCCFRCGKVPCGKDHMNFCHAAPSEWLPKWESVLLREWVFAQRGSFDEHYVSQRSSNNTAKENENHQAGSPMPAHSEPLQNRLATKAFPKIYGTIDIDAFRDILEQDSSLADQSVVRRLGSRDKPEQMATSLKRITLNDFPTNSLADENITGEDRQSPFLKDADRFREESSNRSRNLETSFDDEDGPVLIRKNAAFNLGVFTGPKPRGFARAVFTKQGEWVDPSTIVKPKNRGPFRNINFASHLTAEAGANKENSPNGNGELKYSFLDPIAKEKLYQLKWQEVFKRRGMIEEETWKLKLWEDKYAAMEMENALLKEQLKERQAIWSIPPPDVNEVLPRIIEPRREDGTRHDTHGSTELKAPEPKTSGAMTVESLRERIETLRGQNNKVRRQSNSITRDLVRTHGGLPGPSYTGVGTIRKKMHQKWGFGVH